MSELTDIFRVLKDASPWVVLAGTVVVSLRMWLSHREHSDENSMAAQTLSACTAGRSLVEEVKSMIVADRETTGESLKLLRKIAQELVNLNASQPGKLVSIENSKLMIQYQWSWCRDETARVICASIESNNFRGSESIVVRRVHRAWKQAAKNAAESLEKIQGLSYPFAELFDRHLQFIWETVWDWAVPLYHRELPSISLSDALTDLRARVDSLFDDTISAYFELSENIDNGLLYGSEDVRAHRSGEFAPHDDDHSFSERMRQQLEGFTTGSRPGFYPSVNVKEEIRRRHEDTDRYGGPGAGGVANSD